MFAASVQPCADFEADYRFFTQGAQSLKAVVSFDQYVFVPCRPDRNRGGLTVQQDILGQPGYLCRIQRFLALTGNVNIVDGQGVFHWHEISVLRFFYFDQSG